MGTARGAHPRRRPTGWRRSPGEQRAAELQRRWGERRWCPCLPEWSAFRRSAFRRPVSERPVSERHRAQRKRPRMDAGARTGTARRGHRARRRPRRSVGAAGRAAAMTQPAVSEPLDAVDARDARAGGPDIAAPAGGRLLAGSARSARHTRAGRPRLRRAVLRVAHRPGRGAEHLVRREPQRDDPDAGHRPVLDLRAPPGAVLRQGARRIHPGRERTGHRVVEAGQTGRRIRQAAPGPGAAHDADRRRPGAPAAAGRSDRGDRGRAPVHGDARHPQARGRDDDLGRPRDLPVARPHPRGGDEPDHGAVTGSMGPPARPASCGARISPTGTAPDAANRAVVMGVLNVTPDSFSDGGRFLDPAKAVARGRQLAADGVDIVDVGGESTRPGAHRVPADVESERVVPVISELTSMGIRCSVDTTRAVVADAAVRAGAVIVNDVSGGLADPDMAPAVADAGVPWILMHWRGHSADMDSLATYHDVVSDVRAELLDRVAAAVAAGVDESLLVLDPGLGFAKTADHNWALLRALPALTGASGDSGWGFPVLIGASRKRFLGALLSDERGLRPADGREAATTAISALAAEAGVWGAVSYT